MRDVRGIVELVLVWFSGDGLVFWMGIQIREGDWGLGLGFGRWEGGVFFWCARAKGGGGGRRDRRFLFFS